MENENEPLLEQEERSSEIRWCNKRRGHSLALLVLLTTDVIIALLLFIIYVTLNKDWWDGFPRVEQLVPLDLLLLAVVRSLFLYGFVRQAKWLVAIRIPILTTFVSRSLTFKGSFLYIMVRAKFATTATAFVTLGFAFIFCWAELLIYIHAMLIHGTLYWAFQFTSSIADIESPEQNLDFEDSEFVFPESPTYNKTPHLTIAGQELSPTTNSNTQITMGTSAPITIAVQSFRKTSSIDNLSAPRTFPLEKISESAHLEHQDTYRYYLKRHAELVTAIKYIQSQNANEATKLLTSHSRHLILPRFALQLIEVSVH